MPALEAVRYQLAMQAYAKTQDYQNVHPLVAFSGSILPDDQIPEQFNVMIAAQVSVAHLHGGRPVRRHTQKSRRGDEKCGLKQHR